MTRQSKFSEPSFRVLGAVTLLALLSTPAMAQWDYANTSLISDVRARGIGDILTVIIEETKETSKNTQAKSAKKSGIDAGIQSLFYPPSATSLLQKKGQLPALKLNSSSSFEGGGNISSKERMASRISVRVVDILPNRHFLIEGTQMTSFGGETQEALLKGIVREQDITPNNSVFSYNLSDVTIRFASKGPITASQKKGWFSSAWNKISPF